MAIKFSSAGLLYVYLNGYEDNGKVFLQQIDTYSYIGEELYYRIMESADLADEYEKYVHIFAILGSKDKADTVISIFENEMKSNFQKILSNKRIKTNTQKLDSIGNDFFVVFRNFIVLSLIIFLKKFIMTMVTLWLVEYVAIIGLTKKEP